MKIVEKLYLGVKKYMNDQYLQSNLQVLPKEDCHFYFAKVSCPHTLLHFAYLNKL